MNINLIYRHPCELEIESLLGREEPYPDTFTPADCATERLTRARTGLVHVMNEILPSVGAAARWMEVMLLCTEDDDREWIKRRRETCLENVKRPPVKVEEFGDLHKAVTETQHRMGIAQPNGNAFRLNGGKRQR